MTPRVFLAMPVNRPVEPEVLEMLIRASGSYVTNAYIDTAPAKYLDDKRNDCIIKFLETDCTHILFWDSDTIANYDAIGALLRHDVPVVSAVIYKKAGAHEPCFGWWDPLRRLYNTPMPFKYNELLKVDIVGTGFLLIRRDVFDSVQAPWFECTDKTQAGEDVFFSLKCREAGVDVWVDTSLHLGHIATPYIITNETYEMHLYWKMINDIKATGRLNEFSEIVKEFTGRAREELVAQQNPTRSIKPNVTRFAYEVAPVVREAYLDYIKNVSDPIYSISWEMVYFLDNLMLQLKPKRILDIGSGFSSFLFRQSKAEVISIEHSPEWAQKTHTFLKKYEKDDNKIQTTLDVDGLFDIVFLDYDEGDPFADREKLFSYARAHCSGVLVLDDAHYPSYRAVILNYFKDDIIFDLKNDTLDRFDRYAIMIAPRK